MSSSLLPLNHQGLLDGHAVEGLRRPAGRFVPVEPTDALQWAAERWGLRYVPQAHANGCVIACLAMLTGREYPEVLAHFGRGVYLHGTPWDDAVAWWGSAVGAVIESVPWQARERTAPARPSLLDVRVSCGAHSHAVVLLPDGVVLDPCLAVAASRAHYVAERGLYVPAEVHA